MRKPHLSFASIVAALALAIASLVPLPAVAQFVASPLQNGAPTGPSVTGSDTLTGLYFGTNLQGLVGHVGSAQKGTAAAVSGCGTSPTLATGSSDVAGKITVGTTAANACVLTFGTAWVTAPFCVVQNLTTGAAANVYVVTTTSITWSSALADSTVLMYHCIGNSGG